MLSSESESENTMDTSAELAQDLGLPADTETLTTSQPTTEDMAAHDYQKLLPIFLEKISFFSKAKLNRVIKALIEYPLENNQPKFSFKDEKDVFYLGCQLMDCKHVLQAYVIKLIHERANAEKALKELEAVNTASNVATQDSAASETQTNKEENNV